MQERDSKIYHHSGALSTSSFLHVNTSVIGFCSSELLLLFKIQNTSHIPFKTKKMASLYIEVVLCRTCLSSG